MHALLCIDHNGLVVSMLASGTRVCGFKPSRSCWIFWASEKSSACLPSEGKWKNRSHVPALQHVKEPSTAVNYECAGKIPCIVPSFASRGLSCQCGAWRLWWRMRGTHWGQGYNRPTGCNAEKASHATFFLYWLQLQLPEGQVAAIAWRWVLIVCQTWAYKLQHCVYQRYFLLIRARAWYVVVLLDIITFLYLKL